MSMEGGTSRFERRGHTGTPPDSAAGGNSKVACLAMARKHRCFGVGVAHPVPLQPVRHPDSPAEGDGSTHPLRRATSAAKRSR
jgi:hypothetical protein